MKKILLLVLIAFLVSSGVRAQPSPLLMPIGGGYSDIYAGFSQAAVANAHNGAVKIVVLPSAYSTNAESISDAERAINLRDAEERRFQIEEACKRAANESVTCSAVLAPIFTRSDTNDPASLILFADDLSAIFILGGDQTVAMKIIIGTPLETRLAELYQRGVIVAGTSAGGGMQSRAMLAGYNLNYAADTALNFGAADVWNTDDLHGLTFGIQNAILDQHFHQRGRLPRLLNAIALPGVPHIGIGVDAYTGVNVQDEIVRGVFGLYTVTILDAETYHSADGVQYVSAQTGRPPLVSLRNVIVHLLSPGNFSYDLSARRSASTIVPEQITRSSEMFALPAGAGALYLAGNLADALDHNPILAGFIAESGGAEANILLVAAGYPSARSAESKAAAYASALGVDVIPVVLIGGNLAPIEIPGGVTGIMLIARDQSQIDPALLAPVKQAWLAGLPVFADDAAAAALGSFYSAHEPISNDAEEQELAAQKSFWQGRTKIAPGLNFVPFMIEPQVMSNNRWGRMFSLAYNHPDQPVIGLNDDTALVIHHAGAQAHGSNVIFTLDFRGAKLALGDNEGFVVANGLLDVFAPTAEIQFQDADINDSFVIAPTPLILPAPTETPTPMPSSTPAPTQTSAAETPSAITPSAPDETPMLIFLLIVIGAGLFAVQTKKQR